MVNQAQTMTNVLDAFNTNSSPNGSITNEWSNWFGGAFQSLALDAGSDANGNPASGSLKIVANYPVATDQITVWNGINGISPGLNALQYTNFQCDVRFAPGSATNSSGKFGNLEFGVPTPGYGQNYFGSVAVSASNTNWVHVSIALNASSNPNLQNITGLLIHIWGAGLVGPSTLWVDNIQFTGMITNVGTVTVNYTNTQQRIDGFGASSAWMSGTLATSLADLLFSTNTGAGLSLLRTRIAPDGTSWENGIAQQAQARGARIWSTPWSPPTIYKGTNGFGTNSVNGGSFASSGANYQGYANLLAKYVVGVKNNYGINLYALSVQNEPNYETDYESCRWSGQQIHDFVPYLSAALVASNVAGTKIMIAEDANWKWNLATNTMSDPATSNLVGIVAAHNYGTSAAAVTAFGTPCPRPIWETEHYFGSDGGITNGLALAQQVHAFLTVAQASAYHYWWLTGSGNGSIVGSSTANPAKRLFVLGNYSKFVRPNFYRVGTTNTSVALVTAFKDPGSSNFVIVAANPSAYPVRQTFVLTNFPATGTMTQWVTSASLSLSNQGPITVTNNSFTYLLPEWTVVSFNFIKPVTNAPSIVQSPTNQTGMIYGAVTFNVVADGSEPLAYQWFFNGTNRLSGATNTSLTLSGLTSINAGNYSVIVTNFLGSITSAVATLTVSTNAHFVLKADDGFGSSSFNAAGNWTNTATGGIATFAPTNGFTYRTGPFTLRTPAAAGNYTFNGDALTISAGGSLNIKGGGGNIVTFSNLILSGTINNSINQNQTATIAGNLTVVGAGSLHTQAALNDARAITNLMDLHGSGALTNLGLGTGPGYVVYQGANTGFTGPLIVTSNTTLQVATLANLGGNPPGFNAGQLTLNNGTFVPTASMSLNHPNSGVTIAAGGGVFGIPAGVTLTVSNPMAGPGNLLIAGGGTLVVTASNSASGGLVVSNSTLALVGNASLKNILLGVSNNAALDLTTLNAPLTVSNRIALAGNLRVNLNSAGMSSRLVASNIVFGGVLTLSNVGPAWAVGNSFPLFAASQYSGAFSSIVPAAPGANLAWDTSALLSNGTLSIRDTTLPTIIWSLTNSFLAADLNCSAPMPDVTGTNYVIATDEFGPLTILQSPTNRTILPLGTNFFIITVIDVSGNSAIVTNRIVVEDQTPPLVTLNDSNALWIELGTVYVEPDASALDSCVGVVSVVIAGTINTNALGTNSLTYTASDNSGNTNIVTRVVVVRDTTPPTVSWSFTNLTVIATGGGYALMPEITGTNFILAADLSGAVLITQSPATGTHLGVGTNLSVLTVTDSSLNSVSITNRIVVVTVASPVITSLQIFGSDLVISGTNGGLPGSPFYTLNSTNLTVPLMDWTIIATNQFGPGGAFMFTNPWSPAVPRSFFLLRVP